MSFPTISPRFRPIQAVTQRSKPLRTELNKLYELPNCFILGAVKSGRNLVAGLQERTGSTETIGNDSSVKENNLENTRNPLIRLGKRVRELRIRRLGVRIPPGVPLFTSTTHYCAKFRLHLRGNSHCDEDG